MTALADYIATGPSKTARQTLKRLEPHAGGTACCQSAGIGHETVTARIGRHTIAVGVQRGKLNTVHTKPVGVVDEPQSDYYPGTYWPSLAQGIAACLPVPHVSTNDLAGLNGHLSVRIYREGAGLKPVAYLEMWVNSHPTRYGSIRVKKIKSGRLLALCQSFAANDASAEVTAALLDCLEEERPEVAAYLHDARFPPPKRPMEPMPTFTF